MMFHRRLQKIHSGKSCNFFFRGKKHDHCSTAADYDRIDKYSKCLYQSCFDRLITFCRSCRTRSRTRACLIGKKSSFDSIHQYRPETTGCHLSKSKCFLKDSCKNARNTADIHHNDQNRDCKINNCHYRHDHIQDLDRRILTKYDHCCNCNKHNRRIDWRNGKCIFKRRNNGITDHLTDTTPADQAGDCK